MRERILKEQKNLYSFLLSFLIEVELFESFLSTIDLVRSDKTSDTTKLSAFFSVRLFSLHRSRTYYSPSSFVKISSHFVIRASAPTTTPSISIFFLPLLLSSLTGFSLWSTGLSYFKIEVLPRAEPLGNNKHRLMIEAYTSTRPSPHQ